MKSAYRALLLALALAAGPAPAGDVLPGLPLIELAPGVWAHQGRIGDFARENGGDLANLGIVIGSRCIAVIDTGGSYRVGAALLDAVRARSALPVCYVIATHMHPDHLLGHAAFTAQHPHFVAAAHQLPALQQRAQGYLQRQRDALAELADGTQVVLPDQLVDAPAELDLGGRTLALRSWRTAHTDNDLTVQDSASGALFTGDLLFSQHLPVIDGSLRGWLKVIPELAALARGPVVPGHGPVLREAAPAFAAEQDYLQGLAAEVRGALRAGQTLPQAVAASAPPTGWELVELYHRRNVTAAYAELEWED